MNISVCLDAMIRELGLEGGQWELFAVNDNASNAKLGVALSAHLTQHLCDIHTLELVVKDAFNNTPGMKTLLKKTKKLAKYMHKSTVAARELKREAHHQNIRYRKLANPPNTRWSGRLTNLASVQHLKKPLTTLTSTKENWHRHHLTPAEWKLVEGAVVLLSPVKDTVAALEGEKEPTINRKLERLYSMHCLLDEYIANKSNGAIGLGRELKRNLEKRFPEKGTTDPLACMGNYFAPDLKGIHLEECNKLEETKDLIEQEWDKIKDCNSDSVHSVVEAIEEEEVELSPTSKLRRKMEARVHKPMTRKRQLRQIRREMIQYEGFSLAQKGVNVLEWFKSHEHILPNLSKVAKKVLTVPASSAKSERVFSQSGNFVSKKRGSLAPKKVEELCLIKLNKRMLDHFKESGGYEILPTTADPFNMVNVDLVLQELFEQEEAEADEESDGESSGGEGEDSGTDEDE